MTPTTPKSMPELDAAYDAAFARRDLRDCTDLLIQIWTAEAAEDSPAPECLSAAENDNAAP